MVFGHRFLRRIFYLFYLLGRNAAADQKPAMDNSDNLCFVECGFECATIGIGVLLGEKWLSLIEITV
jgi:hypothetical protein